MQTCQLAGDIQNQRAGTLLPPSGNPDFRPPVTAPDYCRLHRDLSLGLLGHLCKSFYGNTDPVQGCGNAGAKEPKEEHPSPEVTRKGGACGWVPGVWGTELVAPCCSGTERYGCIALSFSKADLLGLWTEKMNWPCGFSGSEELPENWMLAPELSNALGHAQPLFSLLYNYPIVKTRCKKKAINTKTQLRWKGLLKGRGHSNLVEILFFMTVINSPSVLNTHCTFPELRKRQTKAFVVVEYWMSVISHNNAGPNNNNNHEMWFPSLGQWLHHHGCLGR